MVERFVVWNETDKLPPKWHQDHVMMRGVVSIAIKRKMTRETDRQPRTGRIRLLKSEKSGSFFVCCR